MIKDFTDNVFIDYVTSSKQRKTRKKCHNMWALNYLVHVHQLPAKNTIVKSILHYKQKSSYSSQYIIYHVTNLLLCSV